MIKNTWISVLERHAPLYTEVLVINVGDADSFGVGSYYGHGYYSHNRYPVAGQFKCTHWQPKPDPPIGC